MRKSNAIFPSFFKYIGGAVALIALTLVCCKVLEFKLGINIINLGLGIIVFSKEKIEDELIWDIRFRAMTSAFFLIVFFSIFSSTTSYFISDYQPSKLELTITGALLIYWVYFIIGKRAHT